MFFNKNKKSEDKIYDDLVVYKPGMQVGKQEYYSESEQKMRNKIEKKFGKSLNDVTIPDIIFALLGACFMSFIVLGLIYGWIQDEKYKKYLEEQENANKKQVYSYDLNSLNTLLCSEYDPNKVYITDELISISQKDFDNLTNSRYALDNGKGLDEGILNFHDEEDEWVKLLLESYQNSSSLSGVAHMGDNVYSGTFRGVILFSPDSYSYYMIKKYPLLSHSFKDSESWYYYNFYLGNGVDKSTFFVFDNNHYQYDSGFDYILPLDNTVYQITEIAEDEKTNTTKITCDFESEVYPNGSCIFVIESDKTISEIEISYGNGLKEDYNIVYEGDDRYLGYKNTFYEFCSEIDNKGFQDAFQSYYHK